MMLMKSSCFHKTRNSLNCVMCLMALLTMINNAHAGSNHSHGNDEIQIHNAVARMTMPGMPSSAAYMTIRNDGPNRVQILSISSPVAKKTEIHTVVMSDGMMKMQQVDKLSIEPGEGLELKPGGYHVMLMGLKKTIEPTTQVPITMSFSNGDKITVVARTMDNNDQHAKGKGMAH